MAVTIAKTIHYFFYFIYMLISIKVLLSWFPIDRRNPLISLLDQFTEPILTPFRRLTEYLMSRFGSDMGMIDFSPLIAFMCLSFIERILITLILMMF